MEQARRGGGLFRESVNVVRPELKLQVEQDLEVAPLLATLNLPHFKSFNLPRELKGERRKERFSSRPSKFNFPIINVGAKMIWLSRIFRNEEISGKLPEGE